jgi:hypothetical protein
MQSRRDSLHDDDDDERHEHHDPQPRRPVRKVVHGPPREEIRVLIRAIVARGVHAGRRRGAPRDGEEDQERGR